MIRIARLCFLSIATLLDFGPTLADRAEAGPFNNLVVFGDSLSDVGNIAQALFINTPGPYYWNGRFSNGPVYAESLATGLGFTPRYNTSQSTITSYNSLSQQYNSALATMLTGFNASHSTIALNQFDVFSLMTDARANPQLYDLTNVSASAAPGLSPGDTSY